jgi:hypothetical protein
LRYIAILCRRVYELTAEGRADIEGGDDNLPWETPEGASGRQALRASVAQLHPAAKQVAMAADEPKAERATAILKEARQKFYQLLAED